MKTLFPALVALLLAGWDPVSALAAAEARDPVPLLVDAAAEPVPALQYSFTYERIDQLPGNAALAYQRVAQLLRSHKEWTDQRDQVSDWLKVPLTEFPTEAARTLVTQQASTLEQLVKASRYEDCDWGIPVRQEGANSLLPHLAEIRDTARLLSLQVRLFVQEGEYDQAVDGLRAGLTLAKQVGDGELLIEGLVGIAIANTLLDQTEELIGQPGAPNLYWALTDLPPGYLNAWQATRWERDLLYVHLPALREARTRPVTGDALLQSFRRFQELSGGGRQFPWLSEDEEAGVATAGLALLVYPLARQQLVAQAGDPETVRQMPAVQVVTAYLGRAYAVQRDNFFKWFALPYPEARAGLQQVESDLAAAQAADPIGSILPRMLLPALSRARERFVELDRRLALLRCVEAVRNHAAAHGHQLPRSLAEIQELPVPPDPVTGQPFGYRLEGSTAVIEAAAGPPQSRISARSYRLTLR